MLSDALFESVERLDHYLADPDWRSDYDPATLARADAIRAAMDALRGMLDAYPQPATPSKPPSVAISARSTRGSPV